MLRLLHLEDGRSHHFAHHDPQNWCSSGSCPQSLALLPVYPAWLCGQVHYTFNLCLLIIPLLMWSTTTARQSTGKGLQTWCQDNNLAFNVSKTKGSRKWGGEHGPALINGAAIEIVDSFLSPATEPGPATLMQWSGKCISIFYSLRHWRSFGMSMRNLSNFDRCAIKSILTGCISIWYRTCFAYVNKKCHCIWYKWQTNWIWGKFLYDVTSLPILVQWLMTGWASLMLIWESFGTLCLFVAVSDEDLSPTIIPLLYLCMYSWYSFFSWYVLTG